MTVLLDDGKADPGTHVLLIGVGRYPFLNDGGDPANLFPLHMGMGQLSSPPLSVSAFATWLMDSGAGFHNPDRPLRSLQVLCSADVPVSIRDSSGTLQVVQSAQMHLVRQAVRDWMKRAGRNPENMAVFFFCGHGLAFGEVENALLLEDFGGDHGNPMADAIAFDSMRLGVMRHCGANHQVHFIDACRTPPNKHFLATYGDKATGDPIAAAGLSRDLRNKIAPVYFAAGLASAAYGLDGQPSLFTQGLLQSMHGPASRDKGNHWEVQVPALAEGINKCVASMAFQVQPQYCQPRDTGPELMIHRLRADPKVVVKVFTHDLNLLPQTVLAHIDEGTQKREVRSPAPSPWWVTLPAGAYRFEALDAADTAQVLGQRRKYVMPPGAEVGL
ncbi:caspase family protein [Metapseudomonas otitidis]|uniref:Caspase domain-containing protein n=1 Tax=Metapseudomonas otitidis TaxID=319939 RepID=A0A679GGT7_9GAMM|nr:caspase family protein [Pseudomonas otitidis]BCA26730.1 hypothetical protein PtoMrB4_07070 [Pseudomonas otitidis]